MNSSCFFAFFEDLVFLIPRTCFCFCVTEERAVDVLWDLKALSLWIQRVFETITYYQYQASESTLLDSFMKAYYGRGHMDCESCGGIMTLAWNLVLEEPSGVKNLQLAVVLIIVLPFGDLFPDYELFMFLRQFLWCYSELKFHIIKESEDKSHLQ
ncbi:hypothetical protein QL285_018105 [Trifolium repens]|nr:hypothetical protein QL285_018105 [Trifolium repens]